MKIGIINTGGTISSIGNPLHPMSAAEFAAASVEILNPILKNEFPDIELAYITDLDFPESKSKTLDSTNLQPTDWCLMAAYILKNYAGYDSWIILHGTDSMDFTGGALPFLLSCFDANGNTTAALSRPVIITGSQVPMYYQKAEGDKPVLNYNTDAYQNFCGSVASARTGIPEVCVFFDSYLFRGNRVLKINASEFYAFSSTNYPPLGQSGIELTLFDENILPGPVSQEVSLDNPVALKAAQDQLDFISQNINKFPVMQFNAFPAWYDQKNAKALIANLIDACVAQEIKGLVLESYGEGNFPSGNPDKPEDGAIYKSLHTANFDKGVVIMDCTQVIHGVVNNSAYASGAWLPSVGALNSSDLTPMAALGKIMILLTAAEYKNWTPDQVKDLAQMNLAGEMLSISRLDSRTNNELMPGQSISALDGSATLINDQEFGPLLKDTKGTILWAPPKSEPYTNMPGRLAMQNDGNLVFYNRFNNALWASNTGNPAGASSQLVIRGSLSNNNLTLEVYNYSSNIISATLYKQ